MQSPIPVQKQLLHIVIILLRKPVAVPPAQFFSPGHTFSNEQSTERGLRTIISERFQEDSSAHVSARRLLGDRVDWELHANSKNQSSLRLLKAYGYVSPRLDVTARTKGAMASSHQKYGGKGAAQIRRANGMQQLGSGSANTCAMPFLAMVSWVRVHLQAAARVFHSRHLTYLSSDCIHHVHVASSQVEAVLPTTGGPHSAQA